MCKDVIDICKCLTDMNGNLIWGQKSYDYSDVVSGFIDLDDYNNDCYFHKLRDEELRLIVEKAVQDKFPIQDYGLDDVNCVDEVSVYTFSNLNDNKSDRIDFIVDKGRIRAVPYKYDVNAKSLPNMFPCDNCFDAVYTDF